ncbi:MAG: isochorismate synthase [Actinomycetota bacterium]|nr:isochorismate synthase [Actinomycetota bacterium]MDA3010993.1 isochorismate synthase [Actinomycetota bacterium]MDA3024060.1 isochorismate synthase [Actinomycetota bacterium]
MHARTTSLERDVDLNDIARGDGYLFVRDGIGFAGRQVAARVDPSEALDVLRTIDHDDESNGEAGPIAFGSLPFLESDRGYLVIPHVVVRKTESGRTWLTTIGDANIDDLLPLSRPTPTSSRFVVEPVRPVERYRSAVEAARDAVRRGDLVKAVIARELMVTSEDPIDVHAVLLRLRASFGSSYRYSFDGLIGASPELLVSISDDMVRSHPLAGTTPRTGDPEVDAELGRALVDSVKDQIEHRVVIDVVHDTLLPYCSYLDWEPEPSLVPVANVQHLGTLVEGRLGEPRPDSLSLARRLCPTPALGGHPRDEALQLIEKVEGFPRGRYGGAVGWVDASGNGVWAVTIRCAEFSDDRRRARLVAGGGIVADSDPDAELAETQAKFQAMLSAIVRA